MNHKLTRRHYLRLESALKYFKLSTLNENDLIKLRAKAGFKGKRKVNNQKKNKAAYKKKYYEYLKSPAWQEIRIEMLTAYPKCQRCDSTYILQVHHKTYKNVFKEEPEDLEVLCKNCHETEHKIK